MYNKEHFGVLVITCICSLESLKEICAREIDLEYTESVFIKNLPWLGKYGLDLETDTTGLFFFFDVMDIASALDVLGRLVLYALPNVYIEVFLFSVFRMYLLLFVIFRATLTHSQYPRGLLLFWLTN